MLEIQTHVLSLAWQALFWPSHLPSSHKSFSWGLSYIMWTFKLPVKKKRKKAIFSPHTSYSQSFPSLFWCSLKTTCPLAYQISIIYFWPKLSPGAHSTTNWLTFYSKRILTSQCLRVSGELRSYQDRMFLGLTLRAGRCRLMSAWYTVLACSVCLIN